MMNLKVAGEFLPDRQYYENLIAKAILFKQSEKIIQKQQYGGYRANIVTYTIALISYKTDKRIDLARIWKEQSLSQALIDTIINVSSDVKNYIISPPDGRNVTEYCKREQCWDKLLELPIAIPDELINELSEKNQDVIVRQASDISEVDPEDIDS